MRILVSLRLFGITQIDYNMATTKRKSIRPNRTLTPKAGFKPGRRLAKGGKICRGKRK